MSKLHAIKHDLRTTLWCGPAALSTITGKATSHVHEAIRQSKNPAYYHKPIKGVSNGILVKAAQMLGCEIFEHFNYARERCNATRFGVAAPKWQPPTLARFCREHRELLRKETLIINVTGHYVVVSGRSFIDNHTKQVVPLSKAPHRRCRVQASFVVRAGFKPDAVKPATPKPVFPSIRGTVERAKQFDIIVEPHLPGEYWVYPPPGYENEVVDPYFDEHLAYDADEARKRVDRYIQIIGEMKAGEVKVAA